MKSAWKKTVIAMKSKLNPLERLDICKWLKIVSKFCFYFKDTETGNWRRCIRDGLCNKDW